MATYYRWRKSRIGYDVDKLSTRDEIWLGNAILGETIPIYWSINKNSILASENGIKLSTSNQLSYTVQESRVPLDSIGMSYFSPFNVCIALTTSWQNAPGDGNIVNPEGKDAEIYYKQEGEKPGVYIAPYYSRQSYFVAKQIPGTFVDYVYSTSSSAYPNGGVSGEYYYDQRTTVTSPTAPTGLTYPNPITTPKVTVSWNAATSNVPDVPIKTYYLTAEYFTNNNKVSENINVGNATQYQYNIVPGTTSITFQIWAIDNNNQLSAHTIGSTVPVYLAPTLTVPQMVMQGQQATINWTAISGADSYTVQRKANTDADWTQVYSGTATTFSETVGTWTSVQYRVQAVFGSTPGGWAESAAIPVVSASALVISGTDSDLGTVVNDIPYSISTDTGDQITAKITVNSAVIFSGNVGNSAAGTIPVLDLFNGQGTIVIEASVQATSGVVSVTRSWTYTKAAITFPDAGSVADLTQQGKTIWAKTLAEAVRTPSIWGGNLGLALQKLMGAVLYNPNKVAKYTEVKVSLSGKNEGDIISLPENGKMVEFYVSKLDYESALNGTGRVLLVRKTCYDKRTWDAANVSAYATSDIDTWLNGNYKGMFPEDVQTAMGTTKFYYTPGNGNWTVGTLERSVFLLSGTELGYSEAWFNVEGTTFPTASILSVASVEQWTRTPMVSGGGRAVTVQNNAAVTRTCAESEYSRPCFTLPSTFTATYYVGTDGTVHDEQEYEESGTFTDISGGTIPMVSIETGSYVGTGTFGPDNPNTLTFPFKPDILIIQKRYQEPSANTNLSFAIISAESGFATNQFLNGKNPNGFFTLWVTSTENSISWYAGPSAGAQQNGQNISYYYTAIGKAGGAT